MALRTPHRVALGAVLLLGGGLLAFVWQAEPEPAPAPAAALAPPLIDAASPVANLALPERLLSANRHVDVIQRIRARQVDGRALFSDEQAFVRARQKQVLFATGDVIPRDAAHSPLANERRLQDGRHWIRYDMEVLAARAEGDVFLLPLMGSAVEAEIEAVDIIEGQYRWSGRLLGPEGGTFHITQALGDGYAVGAITTPHGQYLLEAKGGKGWLAESHKEFFLPPDGNDTVTDDGAQPAHSHSAQKH